MHDFVGAGQSDCRTVGWRVVAVAALLSVCPIVRLSAQVSLHATIGARYSTAIVHDSVVVPVDVQPAIGPAVTLSLREQTRGAWTPDANLDLSWASLQRHESGSSTKINSVTTIAFTVGVRHAVTSGLTARAGLGALKYLPAEKTGLFRDGSSISALGALSLDWTPMARAEREFGVSLRYDVHGFTTPALHAEGFTARQPVHRVSVGVTARILGKGASTP